MRHGDVRHDLRGLQLADTKTGKQLRPAGKTALDFLREVELPGPDDWVIPAARGDGRLVNIRKPFLEICKVAKLEGVTPHVLRHSFATVAAELEYSELTIAGLLGHTVGSVTGRYAHRVDSALSAAADRVSAVILARMEGREASAVIVRLGG